MRGRRFVRVLKVIGIAIVAFAVFGFVASRLWNYVMPGVFGLHAITFWQAIALVILGRLLFGGFRRPWGAPWGRHMRERWANMTPEEREKFRQGLRSSCGHGNPEMPDPSRQPAS
jgi:hypothetical protein